MSSPRGLLNVFEPGLLRGSAKLPFAPTKSYFYVEHPVEGWRVYLRAACFLHEAGQPFEASRFLVVKRTDANPTSKAWEPPKGQMEAKDANPATAPLLNLLAENMRREVAEEAKIEVLQSFRHTGLVIQSHESDYPENTYFQYHIFQAVVPPEVIQQAAELFDWYKEHPSAFARLKKDKREKDALAWYDPKSKRLMGKWSPSIVALYLANAPALED